MRPAAKSEKPVRLPEQRKNKHEVDEIAARRSIEQSRETLVGRSRNRGKERTTVLFRAHHAPIDEPGRSQVAEGRRGAKQQRPRRPNRQAPTGGHARKDDNVNDIVAPEIDNSAKSRFLKLQPGQLSVASVQDRMCKEQKRSDSLPEPEADRKKGAPNRPMATETMVI